MPRKRFQDILPLVEKPSRYLGTETNRVRKNCDQVKLAIALAFPDLYEIGTSHFGMQILYDLLNRREDIAAERVFAPGVDAEARLRSEGIALSSLESGRALGEFDMIGFSLLYELNYTNILTILDLAGIPFYARDRDDTHPIVIAGGPCTCNPEPVADFFDAMVLGDGEGVILALAEAWMAWKGSAEDKAALLRRWAAIPGVYIPALYTPVFDGASQTLVPRSPAPARISRAVVSDLDAAPFPASPVVPFGKPVHDRLRIEVARGCTRGCRFCQAGMIYRPVRERSVATILKLARESLAATGYDDLSLLSLSTGDYSCIVPLLERLMDSCEPDNIAVSLPSLRAGSLTAELIEQVRRVRKTGFTIAPEAGSQRMRDIVNKNISEADIISAVQRSFELGWHVIKLYFMIGLPFEEEADVNAIVDLVEKLRPLGRRRRGGKVHVSVATFIPKAHTPFQWAPQLGVEAARERIWRLKDRLRRPGVEFKWQDPCVSYLEGLWARGDRRLAPLLVAAYRRGCRFDGWSDQFRFERWQDAFGDAGIDPDLYITRKRSVDEALPWDHIDIVAKQFLREEWLRAAEGRPTGDCRHGECNACGVCDFDVIKPVVHTACAAARSAAAAVSGGDCRKYRLTYRKTGPARFFGHLEMVNLFMRAIRRARIPIKHTEGFHPKPKLAFEDALPIGMESLEEHLHLSVADGWEGRHIIEAFNRELPEGIRVTDCRPAAGNSPRPPAAARYRAQIGEALFDEARLAAFLRRPEALVWRTNKKGRQVAVDLKKRLAQVKLLSPTTVEMTIECAEGGSLRPAEVIREIFQLGEDSLRRVRILKMGSA